MNPLPNHQKKGLKMTARLVSLLLFLSYGIALAAPGALAAASDDKDLFSVDDYLKYKRIIDLRLSSDGEMIAYLVQVQSLEENKAVRTVYVSGTNPGNKPTRVEAIQDARRFAWKPGTKELAFLSNADGKAQVYAYDFNLKKRRQLTKIPGRVTKFKFSRDGSTLAFLSQTEANIDTVATHRQKNPFYDLVHNGESGVLVDTENIGLPHFFNPNRPDVIHRPQTQLWLKAANVNVQAVAIPGQPKDFHLSADGTRMSVVYVDRRIPRKRFFGRYTSIGIVTIPDLTFDSLFDAEAPATDYLQSGQWYTGGEWSSEGPFLHVRRLNQKHVFFKIADWTVIDFRSDTIPSSKVDWQSIEDSRRDIIHFVGKHNLIIEKTLQGERALFKLDGSLVKHELVANLEGTSRHFDFSAESKVAAFVKEDLVTPPEIYVSRKEVEAFRLTNLNAAIAEKQMPRTRDLTWESRDGTRVHGWLIEPPDRPESDPKKPWPLITFAHGGPAPPYRNEFAFHFYGFADASGMWPYPFLTYANHGMAVFIPNYRGTKTYGEEFGNPKTIDGEPVDDVVSGIEHLIDLGIADPAGLAISGFSHGAWLGPLVMTRYRHFKAASFAEGGGGNYFVLYDLFPGALNRRTHDVIAGNGQSPYENPQRYIDLSPSFHFEGLETAVLAEAGVRHSAILTLGLPKAAKFAGMPAEFIVYPKTGHVIEAPRLKKESANRNLDWFRFWLLGEEDSDPAKTAQYTRWREMRNQHKNKKTSSGLQHGH